MECAARAPARAMIAAPQESRIEPAHFRRTAISSSLSRTRANETGDTKLQAMRSGEPRRILAGPGESRCRKSGGMDSRPHHPRRRRRAASSASRTPPASSRGVRTASAARFITPDALDNAVRLARPGGVFDIVAFHLSVAEQADEHSPVFQDDVIPNQDPAGGIIPGGPPINFIAPWADSMVARRRVPGAVLKSMDFPVRNFRMRFAPASREPPVNEGYSRNPVLTHREGYFQVTGFAANPLADHRRVAFGDGPGRGRASRRGGEGEREKQRFQRRKRT